MAVSSFARVFPTFECRSDPDLSGNPNPEKQSSSRFSTSLRRSGGFSSLIFRFPPNFVRQLSVKSRRNCINIGVAQVVTACWSNPGAVPVTNSAAFVDFAVDVSVAGGVLGGSSNSSNGVQLSDSADSKAPIFSLDGSISVHAGERFGCGIVTDAITTLVVNTSAYMFKNTAELIAYKEGSYKSYEYGRYGNPTTEVLEQKISALEGAESTLFMASGMNASTVLLMALVPSGGHLVTTTDCYRRTRTFIQTFLPKMGISTSVIDPADVDGLKSALNQHRVSLFFTESPTNPYLRCVDIELVSKLCRSKGALLCVDGTFATPINQKALALGADIVLHSATKFIAGHNDVIAGYISGSKKVISAVRDLHHVLGGVLNPNAAYLIIRGMKTLHLRVQQQNSTALRMAQLLEAHPKDDDGSHIKGLLINFFHSCWPTLLKIPSLVEFITPIVKVTNHKSKKVLAFYTMPEYEAWKESLEGNTKAWTIKYYKGLGTNTDEEGKEYFRAIGKHKKDFIWMDDQDGDAIELAFSKKKIEARKNWLRQFEPGTHLNQKAKLIKYSDFVNKELILFSIADLQRSIQSMVDGLKPGQRKILFSSFKRNFVKEIKVSQFSGFVSEHSAYHHGEQSLNSTIIGMAQNYVGSNNINLLQPICGRVSDS